MSDSSLIPLIETLLTSASSDDRIHAQIEIQNKGLIALRPLFEGLARYIKTTVKNGSSPHPRADTPYQQLTFGYFRMLHNIFITWEISGLPLFESLETALSDSNADTRALALVALASPLPSWVENPDRSEQIKAAIRVCQTDKDPVVRASVKFALDQLDQIHYALKQKYGDGALRQRLEKSAFEVIQGIARSS
jgi:hypothetical protein